MNTHNNAPQEDVAMSQTAPSILHFIGTSACVTGLMCLGLLAIKAKLTAKNLRRFLFWDSDQSTRSMSLSVPGHGQITIPEASLFIYPSFTASELAHQALQDKRSAFLGEKLARLSDRDTLNGAGAKPVLGFALGAAVLSTTDKILHRAMVQHRTPDAVGARSEEGVRTDLGAPTNHYLVVAGYGGMGVGNAILQASRGDDIARRQVGIPARRHLLALAPSVCAGSTLNYETALANFAGFLRQVCYSIERVQDVVLPVPGKPIIHSPGTQLFHSVTIFGASNSELCADGRETVAAMAARYLYLLTETPMSNRIAGDFRDSEHLFSEKAAGSPRYFDRVGVSWYCTHPQGRARAAQLIGVQEALSNLIQ
jgi:hypothetical protein